jgi:glycosyltransferase involved in cell wall biosynthesis
MLKSKIKQSPTLEKPLKVAIVHDWLTNMGGAEKVVLAMHEIWPDAPIYTSAFLPEKLPEYAGLDVRTTFIQKLPFFKNHHQFAFLLRALAFYRLDLSDYDVVVSSTTAEAKGVKTKKKDGTGALHICYCNTPTRYYWSGFDDYYKEPGFGWLNPLARLTLKLLIGPLRAIDLKLAARPDIYVGNSTAVVERIKRYYKKEATTLFPCVDTKAFPLSTKVRSGFVIAGRQVPYKRVDLAIAACNELGAPLTVIGKGSEHEKLVALAGPTITFKQANNKELAEAYAHAEALIYPAEEDAGIVPVEAMATGTPVVAFGKGGSLDSIIDKKTGILFYEQTVEALAKALKQLNHTSFDPVAISKHAEQYSTAQFQRKLRDFVTKALK